ncbi:hypothetical protein [Undibacterium sp. Ji22W]|uniref:hypothetical protein n=1 Tax=Undibacterium sp. Ji22W TaxID=3413038 RepID=UPI003BF16459
MEAVTPARVANPANVKRVERLLSANDWQTLFVMRDPSYTYVGFLQAIAKFPAVCADHSDGRNADAICCKGIATMFAHLAVMVGAITNAASRQMNQLMVLVIAGMPNSKAISINSKN